LLCFLFLIIVSSLKASATAKLTPSCFLVKARVAVIGSNSSLDNMKKKTTITNNMKKKTIKKIIHESIWIIKQPNANLIERKSQKNKN
jgi:hypothetical protein